MSDDCVMVETVKHAEDGDGWIVRLYEYKQHRHEAVILTFGLPLARAVECNLLEEEAGSASTDGNQLVFAIAPYEIRTFKIWFGAPPGSTV